MCITLNIILISPFDNKKTSSRELIITKKEEKKLKGTFSSSLDKLETYFLALNGKKKIDFIFDYEIEKAKKSSIKVKMKPLI